MIQVRQTGRDLTVTAPGGLPDAVLILLDDLLTYHERVFDTFAGTYAYLPRKLYRHTDGGKAVWTLAGQRHRVIKALHRRGIPHRVVDDPYYTSEVFTPDWARVARMFEFRARQDECLMRLSAAVGGCGVVEASTAWGKCVKIGTKILMFDGTVKPVEDVAVGDLLMGPDSKPRRVLSLARGRDQLYRVTPVKGDPYEVNADHILSLKLTPRKAGQTHELVNISVRDYLEKSPSFHHLAKGWRTAVEFPHRPVPVDPYFLGLWLGDGLAARPAISKPDPEIAAAVAGVAATLGLATSTSISPGKCPMHCVVDPAASRVRPNRLTAAFRSLGLMPEKFVPHLYKANSRRVRLEVLAGVLDADGETTNARYQFTNKLKVLADDVAYLARSVGLAAYVKRCRKTCTNSPTRATGTYWRVQISGDCSVIPNRIARRKARRRVQKKDVLVTGIRVEPTEVGDYCGFELDGDGLFLLGDFTVTHNTFVIAALHALYPKARTAVVTKSRDVFAQNYEKLTELLGPGVGQVTGGKFKPGRLTVCTADSAAKLGFDLDMVIGDEIHELAAERYINVLGRYDRARMYGFTATLERDDNRHHELESVFGPVVFTLPFREAVAIKAVTPVTIEWIDPGCRYDPGEGVSNRVEAERLRVWRSDERNRAIAARAAREPADASTVIMVRTLEHACLLRRHLPGYTLCYAENEENDETIAQFTAAGLLPAGEPKMTARLRDQRRLDFRAGNFRKAIATYVWSTGLDFPILGTLIRADAGGSRVKDGQIAGRVCRLFEGKSVGRVVDLWDSHSTTLLGRARGRRRIYEQRGYDQVGPFTPAGGKP